jgi:drug/metabolite transporter (DMT)-like permease
MKRNDHSGNGPSNWPLLVFVVGIAVAICGPAMTAFYNYIAPPFIARFSAMIEHAPKVDNHTATLVLVGVMLLYAMAAIAHHHITKPAPFRP